MTLTVEVALFDDRFHTRHLIRDHGSRPRVAVNMSRVSGLLVVPEICGIDVTNRHSMHACVSALGASLDARICLLSGLVRSSGSESAFAPRGVRRPASPLRASRDEDPILRMDMIWSIWGYLWTTSLARLGKAHLLYHTCKRK